MGGTIGTPNIVYQHYITPSPVLSIFVNILLILGCSGKKWRRVLAMPWLIFYGCGVVSCLWTHLYYTSLCWREEKMIGLGCLAIGFIFLIIWSLGNIELEMRLLTGSSHFSVDGGGSSYGEAEDYYIQTKPSPFQESLDPTLRYLSQIQPFLFSYQWSDPNILKLSN